MRAYIFDLDGTLYDKSGLARRLALAQLRRGHLRTLARERIARKALRGCYFENEGIFYQTFFDRFPTPDKAREWYFSQYMPDMVAILRKHYHVAPWVKETMTDLRNQGMTIAVFSDYGFVREKLEAIGFDLNWANFLFDAPSLGGLKPCKESFERICLEMNLQPSDCLMIGDRSDTDGTGARSVGMAFALVKNAECPPIP
jgi:HAD superfamily hydrolase (TIGR01549 family)